MTDVMPNPAPGDNVRTMTFDEAVDRVPFLRALTPADRDRLQPYAEVRRVAAGQAVWSLDDSLHYFIFVVEGHVK
ncbi:MAG TPA: hypothetical protein VMM93_08470, partial [Vicinamibacterales bacterium]|nr:hypothetical protein [Vicinamibacterales bacterium]